MVGPLYGGLDDYELWLPDFDTDFTMSVPFSDIQKEGSFEDCFVNYENLEEYSYDYYAYYAYLKEDYELIEIKNNKQKMVLKLLFFVIRKPFRYQFFWLRSVVN